MKVKFDLDLMILILRGERVNNTWSLKKKEKLPYKD